MEIVRPELQYCELREKNNQEKKMSGGSVIMHGGPGVIGPGGLSDGSWTLTVFVTDLQVERSLRVRGDLHIGGVMIRLVDELGKTIFF